MEDLHFGYMTADGEESLDRKIKDQIATVEKIVNAHPDSWDQLGIDRGEWGKRTIEEAIGTIVRYAFAYVK